MVSWADPESCPGLKWELDFRVVGKGVTPLEGTLVMLLANIKAHETPRRRNPCWTWVHNNKLQATIRESLLHWTEELTFQAPEIIEQPEKESKMRLKYLEMIEYGSLYFPICLKPISTFKNENQRKRTVNSLNEKVTRILIRNENLYLVTPTPFILSPSSW